MDTFVISINSLFETERFGTALGREAQPGDVICLDGDLGAGKTTLSQAIARGLEVPSDCYVTSPSFAILHEYPGRIPMYHMDFYRLGGADDVIGLGFEEYFYQGGLTVIEWSSMALEVLPDDRLNIRLETSGDGERRLICSSEGQEWFERLTRVLVAADLSRAERE